jgi:hypothetical protein
MTAKADVLRSLDHSWNELNAVIDSLAEPEMVAAGVTGDWSVKDLLGHMAFWSERAANTLTEVSAGRADEIPGPETEEDLNDWNARESAAREGKTLPELRKEWEQAHQSARAALEKFPEDKLDQPFKEGTVVFSFGADTFAHYQQHATEIRSWLNEMETSEE